MRIEKKQSAVEVDILPRIYLAVGKGHLPASGQRGCRDRPEVVAVVCPIRTLMFEDAIKSEDLEDKIYLRL